MCPETLPLPSVLLRDTAVRAGIETLFLVAQEKFEKISCTAKLLKEKSVKVEERTPPVPPSSRH